MTARGVQALARIGDFFDVVSGDYHAINELDPGQVPVISCGDTDNGMIGRFDVPNDHVYERAITVAYNGSWPLLAKYHPYRFGTKDDVAVLVPRAAMADSTLVYVAALLNRMTWRYSYGRKCFQHKLKAVALPLLVTQTDAGPRIDEAAIAKLRPKAFGDVLPPMSGNGVGLIPSLDWRAFGITDVLTLQRGDFHSLSALADGKYMTVSRVTTDNGVVGRYERPDGARVYERGHITVSTVGGDAFVQMNEFIATDNVIVCSPRTPLRLTTLFFIAFALNYQRWRYGYGRQCYQTKLGAVTIYLPVRSDGGLDEDEMENMVRQAAYWPEVEKRFQGGWALLPAPDRMPPAPARAIQAVLPL